MNKKELTKIKELYISNATHSSLHKSWTKLYATTEDATLLSICKLALELYNYTFKRHWSSTVPIEIDVLPPFYNNRTQQHSIRVFKDLYLKPIVENDMIRIELNTLRNLKEKYEGLG